jgi:hypothetical protein
MAVDAGYRVGVAGFVQPGVQLLVRERVTLLETLHGVAIAQFAIQRHDGRVTVEAGAGLWLAQALGSELR